MIVDIRQQRIMCINRLSPCQLDQTSDKNNLHTKSMLSLSHMKEAYSSYVITFLSGVYKINTNEILWVGRNSILRSKVICSYVHFKLTDLILTNNHISFMRMMLCITFASFMNFVNFKSQVFIL